MYFTFFIIIFFRQANNKGQILNYKHSVNKDQRLFEGWTG